MITTIDPYFDTAFLFGARTTGHAAHAHRSARYARTSESSPSRASTEASFEQAHGSLWDPGLLDRLTTPLTRYHE